MQESLQAGLQTLVDRIAESIRPDQVVPAYLAGGTATWLHLQKAGGEPAEQARFSEDADIHFARSLIFDRNLVVAYKDLDERERLLTLDGSYSIDIGLRHPKCFDDAALLLSSNNGRIQLYLLSPLDLAVTKTGRFQDHDRKDIELMARAGLLEARSFQQRAIEALDYLATDPTMVRINIDEASELIEQASGPAIKP
ncbi:MAG: DUF6036 family nucleotidyltransferase [Wenzhouxiangella sp.]